MMKKRSVFVLVMMACLLTVLAVISDSSMSVVYAAQNVAQGKWGDNITWTINDKGVLTFSGKGEMEQGVAEWTDDVYEMPEKQRPKVYPWNQYSRDVTSVIVKNGITSIASDAFIGNYEYDGCVYSRLETVQLASTVTRIGKRAFYECGALTRITMPDQLEEIGEAAFYSCKKLTEVMIPDTVTTIGDRAFGGCIGLTNVTLPKNLTKINSGVFENCTSLTEITIPGRVKEIGSEAFYNCQQIESVTVPDRVTKIGARAFTSCTSLKAAVLSGPVKKLDRTFSECSALEEVVLPKNVENLTYTFRNCTSLETVDLSESVTTLNGTFANCKALKKLTVPPAVSKIDGKLFYGCRSLEELRILSENLNLKELENKDILFQSFSPKATIVLPERSYDSYRAIMETFLPDTVQYQNPKGQSPEIERSALVIDSGVWGENINWKLTTDGKLIFSGKGAMQRGRAEYYLNDSRLETKRYPWCQYASFVKSVEIKDGITNVPERAFSSDTERGTTNPFVRLATVKLGKSVGELENGAFAKCANLQSVSFPASLKKIGTECFKGCAKLRDVTFPASLEVVNKYAFWGCKKLTKVAFPAGMRKVMDFSFEDCSELTSVVFEKNTNEQMILEYAAFRNCKKLKKIVLPDNIKQLQHTFENCDSIVSMKLPKQLQQMEVVFRKCKNLTSVTIPKNVQYMSSGNFEECKKLKSITFQTEKLEAIGSCDYANCVSLTEITLPKSIEHIQYRAFYGTNISSIVIPEKVRVIGIDAFRDCRKLETVTFGKNVNTTLTFDRCCFKNCSALKEIRIPDNVKKLKYAFQNCTSLEKVWLPKQLVLIEKAFSNCTSLENVTIPAQVTQMTDGSFYNCKKLKKVTFLTEKWDTSEKLTKLFCGIDPDAKIILPKTKYDDYQRAIKASAPKNVLYYRM